jgi:hypothetical protein
MSLLDGGELDARIASSGKRLRLISIPMLRTGKTASVSVSNKNFSSPP